MKEMLSGLAALSVTLLSTTAIVRNAPAAAAVVPAPVVSMAADSRDKTEGQLTTEVKDPRHPEEPWIITTYRLPDESAGAFVTRHMDAVEAVRSALR